jgi:hypothetical protein
MERKDLGVPVEKSPAFAQPIPAVISVVDIANLPIERMRIDQVSSIGILAL